MEKVNYYRRSSAEPKPYDTTEVRHLLPDNNQRAAINVNIAFFRKRGRQGRQEILKKEVVGLIFFRGVYFLSATHGIATAVHMY